MKFQAEIYLPGHGSRVLTLKATSESAAWDEARAACSPSERVQAITADKAWVLTGGYQYQPDKVYANYQRTVKLPESATPATASGRGGNHITVVGASMESATALAFLVQQIPSMIETFAHIANNCDDPAGFGPAQEMLDTFRNSLSSLKEVL